MATILSRATTLSRMPSDYDADECPICFEVDGGDIIQLKHATNQEAIKTHKACLSCRELLKEANAPCPWCRDTVLYVAAGVAMTVATPSSTDNGVILVLDVLHVAAEDSGEEKKTDIQLPEGIKKSPCCGILVQRISGSSEMMCGCEAKPAGGTLFKALRGGGCGHEWNWDTGAAIAYGSLGHPAHPRQVRFAVGAGVVRPDVPSCAHGRRADNSCEECPPPWAMGPGFDGSAAHGGDGCCTVQ